MIVELECVTNDRRNDSSDSDKGPLSLGWTVLREHEMTEQGNRKQMIEKSLY